MRRTKTGSAASSPKSSASAKAAAKPVKAPKAAAKPAVKASKSPAKTPSYHALQRLIATTLDDNKAEDIVIIDLVGKSSFADAMLVASGRSARHVVSLADHVSQALREAGYATPPIEGKETGDWVLLDAGDVIVHLFRPEIRQFYNLEKMWSVPAVSETTA
ncbi:MAG: ribosome silencing factor [Alphaproteobacteria bacterium]|nr:ribosome silencing factor [Alphaproteobacteria bacterium]